MSLLPGHILPHTTSLGRVNPETGEVQIDHNWWLLLYNLCQSVLGTTGLGLPSNALQELASADTDAIDSDATSLRLLLANALMQAMQPQDFVVGPADLPDLARALLLAQDSLLPDPPALSQPVAAITPGASPYTYTAPFAGAVAVTGGTVSAIAFIRRGTTVATGLTAGLVPVSRYDQIQVTYTAAPTMTFIPWSNQ